VENKFKTAFSFSLYAMPLPVVWAMYFGRELGKLRVSETLESGQMYCCKY